MVELENREEKPMVTKRAFLSGLAVGTSAFALQPILGKGRYAHAGAYPNRVIKASGVVID